MDKLLAGQLGLLQEQLSGLAARLDAREAAELEGQGVATRGDLQVRGRGTHAGGHMHAGGCSASLASEGQGSAAVPEQLGCG